MKSSAVAKMGQASGLVVSSVYTLAISSRIPVLMKIPSFSARDPSSLYRGFDSS